MCLLSAKNDRKIYRICKCTKIHTHTYTLANVAFKNKVNIMQLHNQLSLRAKPFCSCCISFILVIFYCGSSNIFNFFVYRCVIVCVLFLFQISRWRSVLIYVRSIYFCIDPNRCLSVKNTYAWVHVCSCVPFLLI